jgi:hypothetical protein
VPDPQTTPAAEAWRTFHGEPSEFNVEVPFESPNGELGEHGTIDHIEYRCKRDGKYILAYHSFRPNCSPTLAVDSDAVAYCVRGRYTVNPEHGIVDGGEPRPDDPEIPTDADSGLWIMGELAQLRVSPFTDDDPWQAEWSEGTGPLIMVGPTGALLFEEWEPHEVEPDETGPDTRK